MPSNRVGYSFLACVLCAAALVPAACSDDRPDASGNATETETANGAEAVLHDLLDRLSCDATDAGDYEVIANEAVRGADCWTPAGQLRVHVYDMPVNKQPLDQLGIGVVLLTADLIRDAGLSGELRPDLPAVVGDDWIVVANGDAAAAYANERLGGSVEPVTTPVSYLFPSPVPDDARRRASGG